MRTIINPEEEISEMLTGNFKRILPSLLNLLKKGWDETLP